MTDEFLKHSLLYIKQSYNSLACKSIAIEHYCYNKSLDLLNKSENITTVLLMVIVLEWLSFCYNLHLNIYPLIVWFISLHPSLSLACWVNYYFDPRKRGTSFIFQPSNNNCFTEKMKPESNNNLELLCQLFTSSVPLLTYCFPLSLFLLTLLIKS